MHGVMVAPMPSTTAPASSPMRSAADRGGHLGGVQLCAEADQLDAAVGAEQDLRHRRRIQNTCPESVAKLSREISVGHRERPIEPLAIGVFGQVEWTLVGIDVEADRMERDEVMGVGYLALLAAAVGAPDGHRLEQHRVLGGQLAHGECLAGPAGDE